VARVILRRVFIAVPVLFLVTGLAFVLVSLVPGNAANAILGQLATPEQSKELTRLLGLDDPAYVQYWNWLKTLAHGSLGQSVIDGDEVTDILNSRLPVTLTLVIATTLVSGLIGVAMGFYSALRGRSGRIADVVTYAAIALPSFWIGLTMVALFAVQWRLLPANGYVTFGVSPSDWAQSLVMPVAALSIGAMTGIAVQTRDSTKDVLARDFVRVQLANGFSRRSIAWKHVLRNAGSAILTVIGIHFVGMLSGAVLIETVFALPGMGQEVVTATSNHDLPVIQGAVLYFTVLVLIVNLLVDIAYAWLDPRVRVR